MFSQTHSDQTESDKINAFCDEPKTAKFYHLSDGKQIVGDERKRPGIRKAKMKATVGFQMVCSRYLPERKHSCKQEALNER